MCVCLRPRLIGMNHQRVGQENGEDQNPYVQPPPHLVNPHGGIVVNG